MNQFDPLERELAAWFSETASPQTPANFDDILRQTARIRQRPRWTFPERLLPMTTVTSFRAVTGGVPWRALGALALLLLALLVGALAVGSTATRLPAPFGPAVTGLVAYASDGDIFVVDPATNQRRSIVTGDETDLNPQWSRDGTTIVFERRDGSLSQLFTVLPDGSELTAITPRPYALMGDDTGANYSFSPDGRKVLFLSDSVIQLARSDGSGVATIETPDLNLIEVAWRPPDGSQIGALGFHGDLHLVDVSLGTVQTLTPAADDVEAAGILFSPDGGQLAYHTWSATANVFTVRGRVVDVESRLDRLADPHASGIFWDALPTWSNDGRRLATFRGYTDEFLDVAVAVVPADGSASSTVIEARLPAMQGCCAGLEWAPDDSWIMLTPSDSSSRPEPQLLIDPDTGSVTPAPWGGTSEPAWQRIAP